MRFREIIESASAGASSAGSIAPVSQPLGTVSRSGGSMLSGKYSTDATPNTPPEIKRFKKNARGQFKNSISN
jgi:hypothetical protein